MHFKVGLVIDCCDITSYTELDWGCERNFIRSGRRDKSDELSKSSK